jgi:hypothetical protein
VFKDKYGLRFQNLKNRYAERSDLTTGLIHLTKPTENDGKNNGVQRVLFEILESGKLVDSTTDSGFIVGNTPAIFFQDAPLQASVQKLIRTQ